MHSIDEQPRLVGSGFGSPDERRWLASLMVVFAICAFSSSAVANQGEPAVGAVKANDTTSPTPPAGRGLGDTAFFGAYSGWYSADNFRGHGIGLDANIHLHRYLAATLRGGVMVESGDFTPIYAVPGIRGQLPVGNSTFFAGVDIGVLVTLESGGGDSIVGARAGWEYLFDSGVTVGVDAGLDRMTFRGVYPRAGLKIGYEWHSGR